MRIVARHRRRASAGRPRRLYRAGFPPLELFDKKPRIAAHSLDGAIELMPTSDGEAYAFKYVNGHPKNARDGRQTVVAFGVLADVATGYPVLLSEMTILTALRTAATSALAAQISRAAGRRTMAIIGNGAQCEFQALAFKALCRRRRRFGSTTSIPRRRARRREISRCAGLKVIACKLRPKRRSSAPRSSPPAPPIERRATHPHRQHDRRRRAHQRDRRRLSGQDGTRTATSCCAPTFSSNIPSRRASRARSSRWPPIIPVTELWRVMCGEAPGRRDAGEITLFDSVGFAIEDFAALRYVRDLMSASGRFAPLDLRRRPRRSPRSLRHAAARRRQGGGVRAACRALRGFKFPTPFRSHAPHTGSLLSRG